MSSRLLGAGTLGVLLFLLCLLPEAAPKEPLTLGLLGILVILSDLAALPVPRRGFLSNSFVWVFVLAQVADSMVAALALLLSVVLRTALFGRDASVARAHHALSELVPGLGALVALQFLSSASSYGLPKGHIGTAVSLLVYYSLGRACLSWLYTGQSGAERELLKGATQSREIQFRLCTMLSPATTLLASGSLTRILWMIPVMLAIHQFFWERLSDLRDLQKKGKVQKARLQKTETALEAQEHELSVTKGDKDLVQRCLAEFSSSANLEETALAILSLVSEAVRANRYVLFWDFEEGFGPLLALDRSLQTTSLSPETFPDRSLLSSCYKTKQVVHDARERRWCFPLYEGGVLYVGDVHKKPTELQKRHLLLLARQSSFGLRSAVLFEKLNQTVEEEQRAREEAVQAKQELEVAQAHLIQSSKMAAVGQLAAGVAHELNSPLAALLLAIQAGRRSLRKGNQDKALERFDKCEEAVKKAKHIVDGLLSRSRKSNDEIAQVCLAELCKETSEFLAERLANTGTIIELVVHQAATAEINPDDIAQVLTNLILNSHQALASGLGDKTIKLEVGQEGQEVIVEVSDRGPGIDPEYRDRVFEPFFTTKTQGEGTGLGLYISAEMAAKNKGRLELKSSSAKGTTFRLSLPLA